MNSPALEKLFRENNALIEGHFLLSSGLHSPQYLQCALILARPDFAEKICKGLAGKFKKDKITAVVAPALGGVIVSYEVARALGVKGIFTERQESRMCLRRGFSLSKKDRVLVVEDVITTGKSTKEVIETIKQTGCGIAGVGCIVDRSGGKVDFGMKFERLLQINIPAFKPEDCPICKFNIPLVKPGSRASK